MQLHQRFEIECKHKILIACYKLSERLAVSLDAPQHYLFPASFHDVRVDDAIYPTLAMQNVFQFCPAKCEIHITNKYLDVINNLMLCNNELKTHMETSAFSCPSRKFGAAQGQKACKQTTTTNVNSLSSLCCLFRFKWPSSRKCSTLVILHDQATKYQLYNSQQ